MVQAELFEVGRVHRSRIELLLAIAERMQYGITLVDAGCCEPGYADKPVALANWNSRTHYANGATAVDDDTMPRLAKLLEKLGYETEWEDEWDVCEDCGKAFRTQPNSYSWKRSYAVIGNYFTLCHGCIRENPYDYVDDLNGNPEKCDTIGIDLEQYGYEVFHEGYESGWYGTDDKPATIAEGLRKSGIKDFIFVLDESGQFAANFSVWVKKADDDGDADDDDYDEDDDDL